MIPPHPTPPAPSALPPAPRGASSGFTPRDPPPPSRARSVTLQGNGIGACEAPASDGGSGAAPTGRAGQPRGAGPGGGHAAPAQGGSSVIKK